MKYIGISPVAAERPVSTWRGLLSHPAYRLLLLLLLVGLAIIIRENSLGDSLGTRLQTFVTIFLSIFIEAVPFLLAGSIVSGFIDVFVDRETLYRFVPRNAVLAAFSGGALGLVFPV